MELTVGQEADVQKIMAEMDCPKGFPCYESKFDSLCPVKTFSGTKILECRQAKELYCQMSFMVGLDMVCECPLRRYAALELGRQIE